MTVAQASGTSLDRFAAAFEAAAPSYPAAALRRRRVDLEQFLEIGFPTVKNEDWHYTSVSAIAEEEFVPLVARSGDVSLDRIAPFLFGAADHVAVLVNGIFAPELSNLTKLPGGVRVVSSATAANAAPSLAARLGTIVNADAQAFTLLNAAFTADGTIIDIGADVALTEPIHIVHVADATAAKGMMHPRVFISAGRNSRATVIESYVALTDAVYFTNAVGEVSVGDGATLNHFKIQRESQRAFHVGTIQARQGRDSHYFSFSFAIGGALSRTNVYTSLDGPGCGATLNGLYMFGGQQHGDHQTRIVHAQPNCFSREMYKGILDGQSHGVFNGQVYVDAIAQKTDGKQTNNTLLLSDTAQIDTKPQLEIFADDVKCTHGATVGQIDRTALFYMQSRGIGAAAAKRWLTYAFAADVLETIETAQVRTALEAFALDRFAGAA